MATHSNILAWRILWTEEPDGLPPMGLHRVGHDWSDLAAAAACKESYPTTCQQLPWELSTIVNIVTQCDLKFY